MFGLRTGGYLRKRSRCRGATALAVVVCAACLAAEAEMKVSMSGPGGNISQSLPEAGGAFNLNLPLNKNMVNTVKVTASDAKGNSAEKELAITQVSLENVVISQFTSTPLSVEQTEQLVNSGVINLDNPANYNVSEFAVVLTIGQEAVPISIPIAVPIAEDVTGFEVYKLPWGPDSGGAPKADPQIQIVVFEEYPPATPEQPAPPPIPGVLIIEGRIKSLKEFFSCRLLLMNASGIFTLSNVSACLSFPDGGLSNVLPADGIASFGDILPGDGGQPGQVEKQFIIRGDEMGTRKVRVNFGGALTGPGIPKETPIAFNGSAVTDVEVKGPPTFLVQLMHPDYVTKDEPYEMTVDITNTGEVPALYASLELDVGADGILVEASTNPDTQEVEYKEIEGSVNRPLGHILPGKTTSQTFLIKPLKTGPISSCMGLSDQNITLQVFAGTGGCITGTFPPRRGVPDGVPTVSVLPPPNATGISTESPVVALFSAKMSESSITTGEGNSFNVSDKQGNRIPGTLRFDTIMDRTAAIWQVNDGVTNRLKPDTEYTVFISSARDLKGRELYSPWQSTFTTTGKDLDDKTPPELTLMILPPVRSDYVIPGQVVKVNAYGTDQGSGVVRVECRLKDMDDSEAQYQLVDVKAVLAGNLPPYVFSIDSSKLVYGHSYQIMGTAYDYMGNAQNATIGMWVASSAAPPTVTLPDNPAQPVLHGISVPLTPTQVTGGVREIQFYLDGAALPFNTSTLSPYQVRLDTLGMALGPHTVRAVAVDGLDQTGEDSLAFELADNKNMPVVSFGILQDGVQVIAGQRLVVNASATDPVGIDKIEFYLDSAKAGPIATGSDPFSIDTAHLALGAHTVTIVATNRLGVTNDPADTASVLEFSVVQPPPGQPPAAPTVTGITYPENGKVTVNGQSVGGAKIEVTNTTLGLTVTVQADGSGTFSAVINAEAGHVLRVVAYDLTQSPSPSAPAETTVQAAPLLESITVSPESHTFTNFSGYADLTVTGHYSNGSTANLTSKASFSSSNTASVGVTSGGRAAPIANGTATVTATAEGKTAACEITVHVVVLTHISVSPDPVSLQAINQSVTLVVTAHYSDDSMQPAQGPLSFVSGDTRIATANSGGAVTAAAPGTTEVTVYQPGADPVKVRVVVDTGTDPIPAVTILSPASNTVVERGTAVLVRVRAEDTLGGVTQMLLTATGAVAASDLRTVSPPSLSLEQTLAFNIPRNAPVGGKIAVQVQATDTSGAPSVAAKLLLTVGDKTAPAVRITSPTAESIFSPGETVTVNVTAADIVGVTRIRFATLGSIVQSGSRTISPSSTEASASFSFTVPADVVDPEVRVQAFALDAAGNEGQAAPVDIVIQSGDRTPPATEATAVSTPSGTTATVSYRVIDGLDDLDHVELYFRKDGIGTFNRYTRADAGNAQGRFTPQSDAVGTTVFDSTRMGGDGQYEFYTVGVDTAGNREAAPTDGSKALLPDRQAVFNAGTVWTDITTNTILNESDVSMDNRSLRVSGATLTLSGRHVFKNVELLNSALLTHPETDESTEYGLDFEAWTVLIDSASAINVTGRGYPGGRGGHDSGWTAGFAEGSAYRSSGSHGGFGVGIEGTPNPVYGNLIMPSDLGSGGSKGFYGEHGGHGGGRVSIQAVNLMVDGSVQADGGTGSGSGAGDGSGGSVYLALSTLSGAGPVRADGGKGELPGGGGRVAVHFTDISTLDTALVTATGGAGGGRVSGNGTVFLHDINLTAGELVIDGQPGLESTYSALPIPTGYVFDNIVLRNNARVRIEGELVVNDTLSLLGGSVLTHSQGNEAGLTITAKRLHIDDASALDATGKGYSGGRGPGNPGDQGMTLGGLPGSNFRSAGSYGGIGQTTDGAGPNTVYGTPENPVYLGSGGSKGFYGEPGGNGGGRILVNATQSVEVDGVIRANGGTAGGSGGGDGSGGSVLIRTALFKGMGRISADGGAFESGGGGGRVAVYYTYTGIPGNDLNGLRDVMARGGQRDNNVNQAGSAGTVYFKRSDQAFGDLYVDAGRTTTTLLCTPLNPVGFGRNAGVSTDTLVTDGGITYMPNGLVGLEVNPNLNQNQTYRVKSNTATEITLDTVGKPPLTSVAAVGDQYAAIHRYDNFTVRGGAYISLDDQVVVYGTMLIGENGRVTHLDADPTRPMPRLDLSVDTLRITATGWLEADGRGYPGGMNGHDPGWTAGYADGSSFRSAGSHGGLGSSIEGAPAQTFDSLTDPGDYGSGGSKGFYGEHGGDGGGRIVIRAGVLDLNGPLTSNGFGGQGSGAGSGAGGTINISADTLTGIGSVQANGAGGEVGAGGGRIAVRYEALGMDPAQFEVLGGLGGGGHIGGNGTLYLKKSGQTYGDLVVDGFGADTPQASTVLPGGYVFDNLTARNKAQMVCDHNVQVRNALVLETGSVLTQSLNNENGLRITAKTIEVDADSRVDVSGKGYPGARVMSMDNNGVTIGGVPGARMRSGGSYGGMGGICDGAGPNSVYGIPAKPIYLGSGGSCGFYGERGGNGGGMVWLTADTVTLDGHISANGTGGQGSQAGSGSGGSVWIRATAVSGTGVIEANGGGGEVGGGGGRICVEYANLGGSGNDFDGFRSVTAFGGIVSNTNWNASQGTVLFKQTGQPYGDLYLDAGMDGATASHATRLTPVGYGRVQEVSGDTVTIEANVEYWPNSLAGVEFNPNLDQTVTYTVVSNTANTVTLGTAGGPALDSVTQPGEMYAAASRFDNVYFRGGAYLALADPLMVTHTLDLRETSLLTQFYAAATFAPRLDVHATDLFLESGSVIDVSGRGYPGGRVVSMDASGFTLGGQPGARMRSGGSYGGMGGVWDGAGTNPVYGIPSKPLYLGSGGSCGYYGERGGNGGGAVWLTAETVTLNGRVSANGTYGQGSQAGSGSGGSIWVRATALSGTGVIEANGVGGEVGGGGGRVCAEYTNLGGSGDDFDGLRSVTAFGGMASSSTYDGSAGTVLFKQAGQPYGDLYLDAGMNAASATHWTTLTPVGYGRVQEIDGDTVAIEANLEYSLNSLAGVEFNPNLEQNVTYTVLSNTANSVTLAVEGKPALSSLTSPGALYAAVSRFDNVRFRRGAYLALGDPLVVTQTLDLREMAHLTHFDATATFEPRLDVRANDLFLEAGSVIEADGRGYLGGRHGQPDTSGLTLGNVAGATFRSGGSHGGLGGVWDGVPNPVYGDAFDPAALGSGGSSGWYGNPGGDGGGWVFLWAGSMQLEGVVSANGLNGNGNQAGSGSGGTVNIKTPALGGNARISADGGIGEVGGGGGRVALRFDTAQSNTAGLSITAAGGAGSAIGAAGTTTLIPGTITPP